MKDYCDIMVLQIIDDKLFEQTGSTIRFHSELLSGLRYGTCFGSAGSYNLVHGAPILGSKGGLRAKSSYQKFREPIRVPVTDETMESIIRDYSGSYTDSSYTHNCLELLFPNGYLLHGLKRTLKGHGVDVDNDGLVAFVNSHKVVSRVAETYQVNPTLMEKTSQIEERKLPLLPFKRTITFTEKFLNGLERRMVGRHMESAYSDEVIANVKNKEPVYVNEIGIFLPPAGRSRGAYVSRFLIYELYVPESVEQGIITLTGEDAKEKKNLVLEFFKRSFLDVYQAANDSLSRHNTSLEELFTF